MTACSTSVPAPPRYPSSCCARRRRDARLARLGHVGDGNEPPRQGIHGHRRRGRSAAAPVAGRAAGYKVLFMQGGAIAENAIVPMNLLRGHAAPTTSTPASGARSRSRRRRNTPRSMSRQRRRQRLHDDPARESWKLDPDAAYVHICSNETIGGVEYHYTPDVGSVPLVADMSSSILSRPVDVSKYGLIYGGAQKNIGPAGLTIVIVREDLLGQALPVTPSAFDYKTVADNDSMYNTRRPTRSTSPAGVQVAAGAGRAGGDGSEKPRQGRAAVRLPGHHRLLPRAGGARLPQPDERALQARGRGAGRRLPEGAEARGMVQLKGHRSVGACARRSTTRCPWKACRRWWPT